MLTDSAKAGIFHWPTTGTAPLQSFDIVRNDPRHLGIDPAIASQIRMLPAPNNFDLGDKLNTAGFRFNAPGDSNGDNSLFRMDHRLTAAAQLFFRGNAVREDAVDTINGAEETFPGQVSGMIEPRGSAFSFGVNWTLSPRTTSNFRFGRSRLALAMTRPARINGPMIVASAWTNPLDPLFPQRTSPVIYEATDHVSHIRGEHAFKAGFDFRFLREEAVSGQGIYPNVVLNNQNIPQPLVGPPGLSAADSQTFQNLYNQLLGRISSVQQTFPGDLLHFDAAGTPRVRNFRDEEYHAFLQDDWRIRRTLILNLGIRYEFDGVPFERDGPEGTLDSRSRYISAAGPGLTSGENGTDPESRTIRPVVCPAPSVIVTAVYDRSSVSAASVDDADPRRDELMILAFSRVMVRSGAPYLPPSVRTTRLITWPLAARTNNGRLQVSVGFSTARSVKIVFPASAPPVPDVVLAAIPKSDAWNEPCVGELHARPSIATVMTVAPLSRSGMAVCPNPAGAQYKTPASMTAGVRLEK